MSGSVVWGVKFAYADPPYLGLAEKFYGHLHLEAAAYDDPETHRALIHRLCEEYPDCWALSLHTPSLRTILPMCPEDVRVAAFCKSNPSVRRGVNPVYAWEPVIVSGGRPRGNDRPYVLDYIRSPRIIDPNLMGAKGDTFCFWVFDLLGMEPDDEFHDLFPGSGAVTRAWEAWRGQQSLPLAA